MAELSTQSKEPAAPKLNEREIVAYLKQHPDFLARHPDLLETIELKHRSGSAVSLIEKQVELLRAKGQRLEDRLERLLEAARDNERRQDNVHRLARTLIRAPSLAGVAAGLTRCMREDFDIDAALIGIGASHYKHHDIDGIVAIDAKGKLALAFEDFFRTRLIECGPIEAARAQLLFPKADGIRSAAIVPLEKEKSLGFVALGSRDPERFAPRQGKLFLELTADLVAAAVRART
ncbi:DUF484 family protein [Solimonas terrae]|uniref:DUF484 family protein n=1 Tax=Solimonas terrae TaxID=1396819 RepID=A0A6M2BSS9_9GAMM|nr:DUF484 family protein [Solimonas terrae]NGY05538.1 DUF484 family protein [Solimonas terrae]